MRKTIFFDNPMDIKVINTKRYINDTPIDLLNRIRTKYNNATYSN